LDGAIGQAGAWHDGRRRTLAVNASVLNLEEDDFGSRLAAMLARHGVQPEHLELEFTESALARDNARALHQLNELKNLGIKIAIDDFGTGYSSLSYLQRLPVSVIKIDRSFIHSLTGQWHDQKLVRAMISMAHDLGYRVVAEGVETLDAYNLLASWNCDEAQGHFIALPMGSSELQAWLLHAGASRP
jgi:EAL domain-containing protein (putative c-di-GMP-specific phosphodiesterase class I)